MDTFNPIQISMINYFFKTYFDKLLTTLSDGILTWQCYFLLYLEEWAQFSIINKQSNSPKKRSQFHFCFVLLRMTYRVHCQHISDAILCKKLPSFYWISHLKCTVLECCMGNFMLEKVQGYVPLEKSFDRVTDWINIYNIMFTSIFLLYLR